MADDTSDERTADESSARRAAGGADPAALAERLAAVERAVTDGAASPADLADAADAEDRLARVESTLADLDDRVRELEAATQALRGYVGGVRAVNRDVERRADLALARTEELTPDDAPPDAREALDSRTPDPETLAAAEGDDGGTGGAGTEDGGTDDGGVAKRLRDAL